MRSRRSRSSRPTIGPGRISDDDYRAVVGSLRRDAAEALRTLDRLGDSPDGLSRGRDFRRGGEDRLMGRRAGLVAAAVVVLASLLAAGAAVGDPGTEKARVDGRLGGLRGKAADQQRQAGVLTSQLSAVAEQVRDLQAGVDAQRARLAVLEGTLASSRTRLASLERTVAAQTARLTRLRGQYDIALRRLERRVRDLYMTDGPDASRSCSAPRRLPTSSTTSTCWVASGARTRRSPPG